MLRYTFTVNCSHGSGLWTEHLTVVADYHPLTREQVAELLEFGYRHRQEGDAYASMCERLAQAIPGMTCQPPEDGETADKLHGLEQLLADSRYKAITPALVAAVMKFLS